MLQKMSPRTVTEAATIQRGSDEIGGNRITTFWVHRLAINQRRLRSFLSNFTMADVEVVDPKKCLEESCKPKCVKPLLECQACVKRVQGDESGHKHCTGQYFDYWQCVDKCVGPKLFAELK